MLSIKTDSSFPCFSNSKICYDFSLMTDLKKMEPVVMQRCVALVLVLLLLSLSDSVWAAPELIIDRNDYDFGEVTEGEKIDYVFRYQNGGDEVLTISNLRTSCGCTQVRLSAHRLSPGMVGELQVEMDTAEIHGQAHKQIMFDTNDPRQLTVAFDLRGRVKALLSVSPERVNWGPVAAGVQLTQQLELANNTAKAVTFKPPLVTSPMLNAVLTQTSLAAGEKASLTITAVLPTGAKRLGGYVILITDTEPAVQIKIPISARLLAQ